MDEGSFALTSRRREIPIAQAKLCFQAILASPSGDGGRITSSPSRAAGLRKPVCNVPIHDHKPHAPRRKVAARPAGQRVGLAQFVDFLALDHTN